MSVFVEQDFVCAECGKSVHEIANDADGPAKCSRCTKVDSLISRLQEGPGSRELSDEFMKCLGFVFASGTGWCRGALPFHQGLGPKLYKEVMPRAAGFSPTESVDDALALVPEDTDGTLHFGVIGDGQCRIGDTWAPPAKTCALAISIAILKAQEAGNG